MLTKAFWKGAAERAVRTFIQVWVAVFNLAATDIVNFSGALAQPWESATATAATSAFLSVGTSIGNADFVAGKPKEVREVVVFEPPPARAIDADDDGRPDPAPDRI